MGGGPLTTYCLASRLCKRRADASGAKTIDLGITQLARGYKRGEQSSQGGRLPSFTPCVPLPADRGQRGDARVRAPAGRQRQRLRSHLWRGAVLLPERRGGKSRLGSICRVRSGARAGRTRQSRARSGSQGALLTAGTGHRNRPDTLGTDFDGKCKRASRSLALSRPGPLEEQQRWLFG